MTAGKRVAASLVVLAASLVHADEPKPAPVANPMQQHMEQMRSSMNQLAKTTDPAQRRALMNQHMAQMQAAMKDMNGMMDCRDGEDCPGGARGAGMMSGGGMMNRGGASNDAELDGLRKRQNAMQSMMEQMLQHQAQMMQMMK